MLILVPIRSALGSWWRCIVLSLPPSPTDNLATLIKRIATRRWIPSIVAKRVAHHFTFGRSRVLTPVPPDQVWFFSEVSPHHHIVVCLLIAQIRRMLGQYQPLSTYHLPSAAPMPNLSISVAEKALESLSSPPPFGRE
jgi:hypothetical protein